MATEAGELIVALRGDIKNLSDQLKQASSNVESFGAMTVAKGTLMADAFKLLGAEVFKFVSTSVKQFGEQEQAMIRLSSIVGSDAAQAFSELAEQISRTSTFTDNEIISMQAQLAMFGLTSVQIKQATSVLVDYAAATGKTLPEAAGVMGQALAGNGRQLKQLGIEIYATDTRGERFDRTMTGLKNTFDGMGAKIRDTTLGQFAALHNSFEQFEQEIGRLLSGGGALKNFIQSIDDVTDSLKKFNTIGAALKAGFFSVIQEMFNELIAVIKPYIALWNQMVGAMGNVGRTMGLFKLNIDGMTGSVNKQIGAWKQSITVHDQTKAAVTRNEPAKKIAIDDTTRAVNEYISALQHSILVAEAVQSRITEVTAIESQKRMLEIQNSFEANASYSEQLKLKLADDIAHTKSDWVNMTTNMINSFSTATAKMIMEGGRFSDVLKNLWKQLAEQVIAQIIRMIAEWIIFQSMTGGAGAGLGGFLGRGAAGGMINEPSMIMGLRSGSTILAGEAGPEQFGPAGTMNSVNGGAASMGASAMGGSGGGGGDIHVHISGQFIDGSPSKWQRLVQEQIVPQLRRFSMMQPEGVVQRKRGAMS